MLSASVFGLRTAAGIVLSWVLTLPVALAAGALAYVAATRLTV